MQTQNSLSKVTISDITNKLSSSEEQVVFLQQKLEALNEKYAEINFNEIAILEQKIKNLQGVISRLVNRGKYFF